MNELQRQIRYTGLKVKDIKVHLGVSTPTYYKYIKNPKQMTIATAHKLSRFIKIDFKDLINIILNI